MKMSFKMSHISAGLTAVVVGYASSVAIVMQAATSLGANDAQLASWLLVLGIAMGLTSIGFSWWLKVPVLTAWSTPGAAMLIGIGGQYSLAEVTGGFILSSLLLIISGLGKPIAQALERIPPQLASAMLAAILLPFCLKAFTPLASEPMLFAVMFTTYLVGKFWQPKFAMLMLLGVAIVLPISQGELQLQDSALTICTLEWVSPQLNMVALLNVALPLYIITMLSQNLPGFAMLKNFGYRVSAKPLLIGTGVVNAIAAPMGGFSVNLAAISAAICMNEQVNHDTKQRFHAGIWAGVFYLVAGVCATVVVSVFVQLPTSIVVMLAGFALLGTLQMCLGNAFSGDNAEPALLTFMITLAGVNFLGISATLWGLLAGLLMYKREHLTGLLSAQK